MKNPKLVGILIPKAMKVYTLYTILKTVEQWSNTMPFCMAFKIGTFLKTGLNINDQNISYKILFLLSYFLCITHE